MKEKRRKVYSAIAVVSFSLTGCAFSGSTALPPLPGLDVTTPSGYRIKADSNLKGSLVFKDGAGKEIEVKLKQDVEGVVNSQANLAQGLVPLAQAETERQKLWMKGIVDMFGMVMAKVPDAPLPEVVGPPIP
jgi:hypothetical protein